MHSRMNLSCLSLMHSKWKRRLNTPLIKIPPLELQHLNSDSTTRSWLSPQQCKESVKPLASAKQSAAESPPFSRDDVEGGAGRP